MIYIMVLRMTVIKIFNIKIIELIFPSSENSHLPSHIKSSFLSKTVSDNEVTSSGPPNTSGPPLKSQILAHRHSCHSSDCKIEIDYALYNLGMYRVQFFTGYRVLRRFLPGPGTEYRYLTN